MPNRRFPLGWQNLGAPGRQDPALRPPGRADRRAADRAGAARAPGQARLRLCRRQPGAADHESCARRGARPDGRPATWTHRSRRSSRSSGAPSAAGVLTGRSTLDLTLPAGTLIDIEAAFEAIHRAEAAIRRGDSPPRGRPRASPCTRRAGSSSPARSRPGSTSGAARSTTSACVPSNAWPRPGSGSGPTELDSALRSGRALIALSPLRESGYRLLMEALAARGDRRGARRLRPAALHAARRAGGGRRAGDPGGLPAAARRDVEVRAPLATGAPGFEPGITGPKPVALPLGHAPPARQSTRSDARAPRA